MLHLAGKAGQGDTREPAGGVGYRARRPRQQRRHSRSGGDEDDGERRHDPDPSRHDSSIAYAQEQMTGPEGGRGAPRELSGGEIDEFLRTQRIARLGCHADGVTYVVPLIYAYDDGAVVAVTREGRKIAMLRENPRVCVEVDEYDTDGKGSWRSVIAHGAVRGARRRRDRARARASCESVLRAPRAARRSRGRSAPASSSSGSAWTRCRAAPSSGDFPA